MHHPEPPPQSEIAAGARPGLPTRAMGLDIGKVRIGVAVSDPLGLTAQPLETIKVSSRAETLARLRILKEEFEVRILVAGIPLDREGKEGSAARTVRKLAEEWAAELSLPLELVDERFSTREAEHVLLASELSRKHRREVRDQAAAVLILQTWLDRQPETYDPPLT